MFFIGDTVVSIGDTVVSIGDTVVSIGDRLRIVDSYLLRLLY